jgi:cytochrome c peroxidase
MGVPKHHIVIVLVGGLWLATALGPSPRAQAPSSFSALPRQTTAPSDNPTTPEGIALGRLLFWDPILSGAQDIACATCHHPNHGYTDGRDLPIGTGGRGLGPARRLPDGRLFTPVDWNLQPRPSSLVRRNSLTLLNVAFNGLTENDYAPAAAPMFWDVRARGLEAQALEPIRTTEEMRGNTYGPDEAVVAAVARVAGVAEYRRLFQQVFGGSAPVTAANMAKAIATFERSLTTPDSPFDRYMRGDPTAMTPAQVRGMVAFDNHGCTQCHKGPMLSDYKVHVLGVIDNPKLSRPDEGANGSYAFRTPSLRNLAYTAPYMHSGFVPSLEGVLHFYGVVTGGAEGMPRIPPGVVRDGTSVITFNGLHLLVHPVGASDLDPLLKTTNVNSQLGDILAFLDALNDDFDRTVPSRVPSGLTPGGQ